MNQPTIKKISLAVMLATLACSTLMAQSTRLLSDYGWHGKASVTVPYRDSGDSVDANIVIAQYLGINPAALYDTTNGYLVTGPSDVSYGGPFSLGMKFTPSVTCHATQLSAAIGYIEGTKKVRLGIYTDAAGVPGTLIQDGVAANAKIPNFGACCQLTTVKLALPGAALTGGTSYWLVANSDPTAPDFGGAWAFVPGDLAGNDGTGWGAQGWSYWPAFKIQGTNP